MKTTTDPNRIHPDDPGEPEKNPLFTYLRHMDYDSKKLLNLENRYKKGTIGDVEIKELFYDYFMKYFEEARKIRKEVGKDRSKVLKIMEENAEEVRPFAKETIEKVRGAIGRASE